MRSYLAYVLGIVAVVILTGAAGFYYVESGTNQNVHGFGPLRAGFAFLPMSIVIVTMAQIASRIMHRVGAQPLSPRVDRHEPHG